MGYLKHTHHDEICAAAEQSQVDIYAEEAEATMHSFNAAYEAGRAHGYSLGRADMLLDIAAKAPRINVPVSREPLPF